MKAPRSPFCPRPWTLRRALYEVLWAISDLCAGLADELRPDKEALD